MRLLPFLGLAFTLTSLSAAPVMERLERGLVGRVQPDGKVFLSWRLLASDAPDTAFDVFRVSSGEPAAASIPGQPAQNIPTPPKRTKLNAEPLTGATWFIDSAPVLERSTVYFVRAVRKGALSQTSMFFGFPANPEPRPYLSIPLQTPEGYTPGDASAGDLDGDGNYEIVLKQEQNPQDNSRPGLTGETLLQAYHRDGGLLWTINLGKNIREGAHYTQFMVADLDGDGRAEVACKTADGTVDGRGKIIGDPAADHRDERGHIVRGPEYLTVFEGYSGEALATVDYLPGRHPETQNPTPDQLKAVWGDGNANRSERYLAGIAWLDGRLPSLIFCRGYYTRSVIAAWDWRDGKLTSRWVFDSDQLGPPDRTNKWRGQGNHQLSVADVDGDGKQEIIYGAMVVDDNGTGLYSTGWGHGDALHVGDFVPDRPGLEIGAIQERFDAQGLSLRDARTGEPIFTIPSVKAATEGGDKGEGPGRGNTFNIDPRFPGAESWAAGAGMDGIHDASGRKIVENRPRGMPVNFGLYWDGDLLNELLDQNRIVKWNWETESLDSLLTAEECTSANGTKATPALCADLFGDWREEVVWATRDRKELRIYTSTIPTKHRLVTLMHDPQYRAAIAWQNTAYNQPPHPSFALDESLPLPPPPVVEFPHSPPVP